MNVLAWQNTQNFTLSTTQMPTVPAIQYTQDQMRTLTGVSAETVRHWRKTLPYLASKTGKAARFTFADLLALAVTNELVSSLGVHITTVSAGVDALFRLLADSSILALNGAVVLVTPTSATLRDTGPEGLGPAPTQPTLAIPLDPLITRLQQHMLPIMSAPKQAALPFPPEAIRSRA
ncbi:MAG: helix-turn-helix domain-containing protein [Rhodocyclaceae bacterium]|jgi:hypothetical protein|nr:helix-turn-helix domain-containing protein [Rhodocyclaceae bacterium]